MNSAVTNDKIMYASGWESTLLDHKFGMVTNRSIGENQCTPQVLGPEYESLSWTQINVTQCSGEMEVVPGRLYTAFE